ncbi:hypothetical protein ECBCE007MS11_3478 [Escherichia coli BCE007_MS-11]|nr:hypothetical protein ECBCE007MS11_3478 [Escherichia coli BCE007_MS-11]
MDEDAQTHEPTTCDGHGLHPGAPWRHSSPYPATGYRGGVIPSVSVQPGTVWSESDKLDKVVSTK